MNIKIVNITLFFILIVNKTELNIQEYLNNRIHIIRY